MNKVILSGNIGKDIELKTTNSGLEYTDFSVASKRRAKKGEEPKTDWINVTAFGKTAVFLNTYFKKGDGIEIDGRIQTDQYEDKDGKKRTSFKVIVDNVEFPKGKGKQNQESSEAAYESPVSGFTADADIPF